MKKALIKKLIALTASLCMIGAVTTSFSSCGILIYKAITASKTENKAEFWYANYGDYVSIQGVKEYSGDKITIPATFDGRPVKGIEANAFESVPAKKIILPENLEFIGDDAFRYCENLSEINIPDSVLSIGEYAFAYCDNLTEIVIPDSVTYVGDSAFYGCYNLTIYCEAYRQPRNWHSDWNYSSCPVEWGHGKDSPPPAELDYYFDDWNCAYTVTGIGTYTDSTLVIPSEYNGYPVTKIGDWAFEDCDTITELVLPDSVTTINGGAFYDCDNLTSITFGDGLETIDYRAFESCYDLTEVVLPDSVTYVGYSAFAYNDCLTKVVIPDSVTYVGQYAFYYCYNLTIYCEAYGQPSDWDSWWNDWGCPVEWGYGKEPLSYSYGLNYELEYDDAYGGYYYTVTGIGSCTDNKIVIPNELDGYPVLAISRDAFESYDTITEVVIPDSVTFIGMYAFAYCYNLTIYCEAYRMPSGWEIHWNFSNRPVQWGYGKEDFTSNYGLNYELNYDSSFGGYYYTVTSISAYTDSNIVIPSEYNGYPVCEIGDYAFYDCSNLTKIVIPDSVICIGVEAFYNCYNLTSVTLSNKLQRIERSAFCNCASLTKIVIPDSVTYIGMYVFDPCEKLTIYCEAYSQPSGWHSWWNSYGCPVRWGW